MKETKTEKLQILAKKFSIQYAYVNSLRIHLKQEEKELKQTQLKLKKFLKDNYCFG